MLYYVVLKRRKSTLLYMIAYTLIANRHHHVMKSNDQETTLSKSSLYVEQCGLLFHFTEIKLRQFNVMFIKSGLKEVALSSQSLYLNLTTYIILFIHIILLYILSFSNKYDPSAKIYNRTAFNHLRASILFAGFVSVAFKASNALRSEDL